MQKNLTIAKASVYHSYPDDGKKHAGLIVIEEIWGVNEHIKSVAERFTKEGYSVLSPELLPTGLLETLTPQIQKDLFDPEKRAALQPILRSAMQPTMQPEYAAGVIAVLNACVEYLLSDEHVSGRIGVMGFCFGGSYSFHLAGNDSRIDAAVPFYGQPPTAEELIKINCPVLAFYGEKDANLMQTLPKLKEDMKKNKKDFEAVVYPGVGHAFFNDTNERAYDHTSAEDAWTKTIAFLSEHLAK